jgi:hypothetical protein
MPMTSVQGTKRLSDKDVKEIFASLYDHRKRPPDHLYFQIVPVVSRQSEGILKLKCLGRISDHKLNLFASSRQGPNGLKVC